MKLEEQKSICLGIWGGLLEEGEGRGKEGIRQSFGEGCVAACFLARDSTRECGAWNSGHELQDKQRERGSVWALNRWVHWIIPGPFSAIARGLHPTWVAWLSLHEVSPAGGHSVTRD